MKRRWTLLAGALALGLSIPQATGAVAAEPPDPRTPAGSGPAAVQALRALRSDADGTVRVLRDAEGDVSFVGSTDGAAMVASDAGSVWRSAQDQLNAYGDAFGIDGGTSKALVTRTLASATGGSVVRAQQVVDGVPVFGGQVVMSLDEHQGLVSVSSATTRATQVPGAEVAQATAAEAARAVTARSHHVRPSALELTSVGRRLYDPAIVHTSDPLGVRPVWQFEVTNGSDIRETVLIGTRRGEVALHFNQAPGINRRICDNSDALATSSDAPVPLCPTPARAEGDPASPTADVNQAYDNLGATSQAYADLDAIDLTDLIGATVGGQKTLPSTVRWCYSDAECPYPNAFWDGTQMVFGDGYAGADDVVGHELTHGYVEHTSNLFYLHQSGSINESVADTIGEIVDHRNPATPGSDSDWTIGEDLGAAGQQRSLKDPTMFGQPDKMTSDFWDSADVTNDNGGVHQNDGVGNKTAYLISQGGSFNGRTVTGIDAGDPGLAKTGRLYLETIERLTSGAEYADLGVALGSTCDELVSSHTGGFTAANCASVRTAAAATELALAPKDPTGAAPEAPICPTGYTSAAVMRDNDTSNDFQWSFGQLWQRTPENDTPSYAHEGDSSLFAWDPNPADFGDQPISNATSTGFQVPAGKSVLHFHHAYVLDWTPADASGPAAYYDGAQLLIQTQAAGGGWTTVDGLPWVNGPNRTVEADGAQGQSAWSGDSQGYGSSRVDLSSLAGRTVRVVLRVTADETVSFAGWWVDDLGLYGCSPQPPSAPRGLTVQAGLGQVRLSWSPPASPGGGVTQYLAEGEGGRLLSSSARSVTMAHRASVPSVLVSVSALSSGVQGPRASRRVYSTVASLAPSSTRVRKNTYFTLTTTVKRSGSTARVASMPVMLQRRASASKAWAKVAVGKTNARGVNAWRVKQAATTQYRVVAQGFSTWFGDLTPVRVVRKR